MVCTHTTTLPVHDRTEYDGPRKTNWRIEEHEFTDSCTHTHTLIHKHFSLSRTYRKRSNSRKEKEVEKKRPNICNKSSLSTWLVECWHLIYCILWTTRTPHILTRTQSQNQTCSFLIVIHNLYYFYNHSATNINI